MSEITTRRSFNKKIPGIGAAVLAPLLGAGCVQAQAITLTDPPRVVLERGGTRAEVLLPDAQTGHYRGPRFDWSGMVRSATYQGHPFFGSWSLDKANPTNHDANAIGPAFEFGFFNPLGYDQAKVGETFIKIGVGELKKQADHEYQFWAPAEIVKPSPWTHEIGPDWVSFQQTLTDPRGWGYRYDKRLSLNEDGSMTISCSLVNTGTLAIESDYYFHNFFVFARGGAIPGTMMHFAEKVAATKPESLLAFAKVDGGDIRIIKPITSGQSIWTELQFGKAGNPDRTELSLDQLRLQVICGYKIDRWVLWSPGFTICPEPFGSISLKPGQNQQWSITYRPTLKTP